MFCSEKWGHSLEAKRVKIPAFSVWWLRKMFKKLISNRRLVPKNWGISFAPHSGLPLRVASQPFHFLASAFFPSSILEMHEGAHLAVINACETQFTCCSPDGDTGAYHHHPHAWLMRATAVIFKTCGKFLGLIAVCLFIYWVDRVNRRGLITHPALGHPGRCGKGSSLVLLWLDGKSPHSVSCIK